MDDETITISAKGQVIIPARIRKIFGLRKGDKLKVEIRNRSINMIPKTIDITTLVGSITHHSKMSNFRYLSTAFLLA